MPNFGQVISGHNKGILKQTQPQQGLCNCRNKAECPVQNQCLQEDVIYQATVKRMDNQTTETYVGLTSNTFKARWANHKTSFRLISHQNETKLSTYIWELKRQGINFELKWQLIAKSKLYSPSSKNCKLCLKEKYFILFRKEMATLNKRHEFFTPCEHKEKFKLVNQKWRFILFYVYIRALELWSMLQYYCCLMIGKVTLPYPWNKFVAK